MTALSDKERGLLDRLGDKISELLESGAGSLSDKELGLLSIVTSKSRTKNSLGIDAINATSQGAVSDKEMRGYGISTDRNVGTSLKGYGAVSDKERSGVSRGAVSDKESGAVSRGGVGMGAVSEMEMQIFMNTLSHPVRTRINEIRGAVSDVEFQSFIRQYMAGQIPEGALFEPLPNSQETNLGFPNAPQYAQGSQFYNYDLGTFMPSLYQGGYTGQTGDERFKQGGEGWGYDSYPHGADRNYYGEKMMDARFMPLKLS